MKRLRLSVFRSNKYIYAQVVDDQAGKTLAAVSHRDLKENFKGTKTEKAKEIGKILAKKTIDKKVSEVFFDRGKCKYHGRVRALAEGAREGGLKF